MVSRYFYLIVEIDLGRAARRDLVAQSIVQKATNQLFGECGGAQVEVLGELDAEAVREPAQVLLRVRAGQLRKLRAALTLCPNNIRVLAEAPTLQALV